MILFINTASSEIITLALLDKKGEVLVRKKIVAKYKQSEKLLVGIEKMLMYLERKQCDSKFNFEPTVALETYGNASLRELEGIIVVKGPGSFSALRIGLTTANAMAYGLNIPVVGVKDGEFEKIVEEGMRKLKRLGSRAESGASRKGYVMPEYGREPNITLKH